MSGIRWENTVRWPTILSYIGKVLGARWANKISCVSPPAISEEVADRCDPVPGELADEEALLLLLHVQPQPVPGQEAQECDGVKS